MISTNMPYTTYHKRLKDVNYSILNPRKLSGFQTKIQFGGKIIKVKPSIQIISTLKMAFVILTSIITYDISPPRA